MTPEQPSLQPIEDAIDTVIGELDALGDIGVERGQHRKALIKRLRAIVDILKSECENNGDGNFVPKWL